MVLIFVDEEVGVGHAFAFGGVGSPLALPAFPVLPILLDFSRPLPDSSTGVDVATAQSVVG